MISSSDVTSDISGLDLLVSAREPSPPGTVNWKKIQPVVGPKPECGSHLLAKMNLPKEWDILKGSPMYSVFSRRKTFPKKTLHEVFFKKHHVNICRMKFY